MADELFRKKFCAHAWKTAAIACLVSATAVPTSPSAGRALGGSEPGAAAALNLAAACVMKPGGGGCMLSMPGACGW